MANTTFVQAAAILLTVLANSPAASRCSESSGSGKSSGQPQTVETVLQQLNQATQLLRSYQCSVEYMFSQPLFESKTLRTGTLYYRKKDNLSKLRINFSTLKQDEQKPQDYRQEYIFDGQWLTQLDYQIKSARRRQMAEPNNPVNAFELAKEHFPLLGFTKTEELKEQFGIELVQPKPQAGCDAIHLRLTVRTDSIYEDDYTSINVWIDTRQHLPVKIAAISTEEDIYQIEFRQAKVNKKIDESVFKVDIPKSFGEPEIIGLEKK